MNINCGIICSSEGCTQSQPPSFFTPVTPCLGSEFPEVAVISDRNAHVTDDSGIFGGLTSLDDDRANDSSNSFNTQTWSQWSIGSPLDSFGDIDKIEPHSDSSSSNEYQHFLSNLNSRPRFYDSDPDHAFSTGFGLGQQQQQYFKEKIVKQEPSASITRKRRPNETSIAQNPEFFVADSTDLSVGNEVECRSVAEDRIPVQQASSFNGTGRRRKQPKPRKSPSLNDPTFRGAVLKLVGPNPKKGDYSVRIEPKFVNVSLRRKRTNADALSSDSSSSDDESSADESAMSDSSETSRNSEATDSDRGPRGHQSKYRNRISQAATAIYAAALQEHRRRMKATGLGEKRCASCSTAHTPLWRDAEDRTPLCNACGIRYKKYRLRCSVCWHIPRKNESPRKRCKVCGAKLKISGVKRQKEYAGYRAANH